MKNTIRFVILFFILFISYVVFESCKSQDVPTVSSGSTPTPVPTNTPTPVWQVVGNIFVYNGVPYIEYKDSEHSLKTTVKKSGSI